MAFAALAWEQTAVERTVPSGNDLIEIAFAYSNPGKQPIHLVNVQTSCGCTTAARESDAVAPGAKGMLRVYFDPKGLSGVQEKTVSVFTDDRPQPTILRIRVAISDWLELTPRLMLWKTGDTGDAKDAILAVSSSVPVKLTWAKPDNSAFEATIAPEAGGRRYRISVKPKSTQAASHTFVRVDAEIPGVGTRHYSLFAQVY